MPQAMKIPAATAAVVKECEKLEKIPAWDLTKVRSKSVQERRAQKNHFASLMDMCNLKNAELEAKHQKYKGRIVLRGNIVKDDSGSYAVFAEQGSSASQMTAAKVMDIISRLPGCEGQAADAVSACTQVKNQFGKKVLPGLFLGYALYAGGIWKGDILVADIEELETMDTAATANLRSSFRQIHHATNICLLEDKTED